MKSKKSKIIFTAVSLFVIASIIIGATMIYRNYYKEEKVRYPYILVHGLYGWGADSGINDTAPYWGAGTGSLKDYLTSKGYTVHEASVGPFNSTWDRACELYAQITGQRVDYGEAHAKEHNHERYGDTYSSPLFPEWGKKTEGGQIYKVNLIGHSFGGNTIRMLTSLLEYGDKTEQDTKQDNMSELFKGGKGNYVNSLTTLCTPHNGSTLYYVLDENELIPLIMSASYAVAGLSDTFNMGNIINYHLPNIPKGQEESSSLLPGLSDIYGMIKNTGADNAAYELSPDGAKQLNDYMKAVDSVYCFSYSFSTTKKDERGFHKPVDSTLLPLKITAELMGKYDNNLQTDYEIDEQWLENDGLVNVISARYPFDEGHIEYSEGISAAPGIWNVMPLLPGDHGTVIGLNADRDKTRKFYDELFDMIENLRRI